MGRPPMQVSVILRQPSVYGNDRLRSYSVPDYLLPVDFDNSPSYAPSLQLLAPATVQHDLLSVQNDSGAIKL